MIEAWELAMLSSTGYYGISLERLEAIAHGLNQKGVASINKTTIFETAWENGIDPDNLSDEHYAAIKEIMEHLYI